MLVVQSNTYKKRDDALDELYALELLKELKGRDPSVTIPIWAKTKILKKESGTTKKIGTKKRSK